MRKWYLSESEVHNEKWLLGPHKKEFLRHTCTDSGGLKSALTSWPTAKTEALNLENMQSYSKTQSYRARHFTSTGKLTMRL